MNTEKYKDYIYDVVDFPKPGIVFKDVTPLFENFDALEYALKDMIEQIKKLPSFNKIVAAEARGFLFAAPIAYYFRRPLVLARKPGKLPRPGKSSTYDLEYGSNTLFVSEGSIQPWDKVLVIDDLVATGGSVAACIDIIHQCNATAIGVASLIELDALGAQEKLGDIPVVSCLHY